MSDAFDKSNPQDHSCRCASRVGGSQCAGASVGGQSHASGGAGAGEVHGRTAQPGSQSVDSAGGLFVASD